MGLSFKVCQRVSFPLGTQGAGGQMTHLVGHSQLIVIKNE